MLVTVRLVSIGLNQIVKEGHKDVYIGAGDTVMFTRDQFDSFFELPAPLLTVYVRIASSQASLHGSAAYVPWLKNESRNITVGLAPAAQRTFVKQLERVEEFLRQRTPHEKSLVIFAGPDVWEIVSLQAEVQNELHWGRPAVSQLMWLASEHKPYGLVVVDHAGSRFLRYWLSELVEYEEKKFDIDISQWKSKDLGHVAGQGIRKTRGTQRDVFEKRMDSRYARFCRETAEQTVKIFANMHLAAVFLVGPERLTKPIEANFPRSFRQPVVLFDEDLARVTPVELLLHVEPQIANWEREREAELITSVMSGEQGMVTGLDETLTQLQKGKIRTVVLAAGLDPILRECIQCGWIDRSADPVCPVCGGERQTVTLRDALPALARTHQADIEVVSEPIADGLKKAEGLAGWVRQSTHATTRSGG